MRTTGSRAYTRPTPVPKMPTGLVELMEGMTKEVLRCNPTNVYEFCAAHMQKLLEISDGPTGKQVLTLEQKILKAQNKIKLRAQERRKKYDTEMQLLRNLGDKGEVLPPQTSLINAPVTQDMCLTSIEEFEISHKSVTRPNNSENNKEIQTKGEVMIITEDGAKTVDHSINQIINGLNHNDNTLLNIKIEAPKPILEDNLDDHVTEVISESKAIETAEITEGGKIFENSIVPGIDHETFEKTDATTLVVTSVEENKKLEDKEDMPLIIQDDGQDFKESKLKNEVDIGEINSNIEIMKQEENNVDLKDCDLFDKQFKTPLNGELVSEIDNTVGDIIIHENANILIKNNSQSNYTAKSNKIDIETIMIQPGNEGDIKGELDNNTCNLTEKNVIENNKEITDVIDKSISTAIVIPTYDQSVPESHSLDGGSLNITEQNNVETKVDVKVDKSHLCSDIPPTAENIFHSSSSIAPNDIRGTSNMDLETAAITIQKVFRSFIFKSRASNDENSSIDEDNKETNDYANPNINKERRSLGITRMDTMLQTVNEEKSLSLSTDDSSTLSSAATIIQAHVRGFLVRNRLNSNKTASMNSLLNSEDPVTTSTDSETNQNQKNNKTVLNIRIVPEGNMPSYSRDESIITSMDLSLDGSPPSSINLHPLGYDKSEPRKQLKREDAVQSISPPSNNSGKLSEDVDSTKEILNYVISDYRSNDNLTGEIEQADDIAIIPNIPVVQDIPDKTLHKSVTDSSENIDVDIKHHRKSLSKMSSDEMDVVTPFPKDEKQRLPESSKTSKLIHSGELHDVALPTNVSRSSTSVVRGE